MTRKDYVRIAAALRASKPAKGAPDPAFTIFFSVVANVSAALAADNARFDAARFYDAAVERAS